MLALCVQHEDFEGPGDIEELLSARGIGLERLMAHRGEPFPEPGVHRLVVLMGGSMSVNDEASLPWLAREKAFIGGAIGAGSAVLGICLGAQLIASALGAAVRPNPVKEIGWFPVEPVARHPLLPLEGPLDVFHWHGETFDIPAGAIRLARSDACGNQAFAQGDRILGLQFHPEATPESLCALVEGCRSELAASGPWIQGEESIVSAPLSLYAAGKALLAASIDSLAAAARIFRQ